MLCCLFLKSGFWMASPFYIWSNQSKTVLCPEFSPYYAPPAFLVWAGKGKPPTPPIWSGFLPAATPPTECSSGLHIWHQQQNKFSNTVIKLMTLCLEQAGPPCCQPYSSYPPHQLYFWPLHQGAPWGRETAGNEHLGSYSHWAIRVCRILAGGSSTRGTRE